MSLFHKVKVDDQRQVKGLNCNFERNKFLNDSSFYFDRLRARLERDWNLNESNIDKIIIAVEKSEYLKNDIPDDQYSKHITITTGG